ncbi:protein phosphatase 2C domain-containing protein [Lutimonas sp.]|uniref:protein phosphatase 2C domain-containing protein n=1 Tax=Lutimonas sp. TaxID=1872403 RepID=UPI003D9AEC47
MEILTLLRRGIYHHNFNEDFLGIHSLSDDIVVAAVMDGCSSAKDSQFSSALYAKSLHKSARMLPQMKEIVEDFDLETMSLEGIATFFMNQLFDDLKRTKKLFFLETKELLSTIVLLVINKSQRSACVKMSGDGIFAINGEITEIDQNNIPNFLGYHLNKSFEDIDEAEIQTWHFESVNDVSISTDGIQKLKSSVKKNKKDSDPRVKLLIEGPNGTNDSFLENQYQNFMDTGFIPLDDIGVIRFIL